MKRVQWVDVAKYICIMFVMIGHLEVKSVFLEQLYPPFYLNGFFFVAGYVYYHRKGFKNFFVKKVKCIFVPWFVFSVMNICLSHVVSFNEHQSLIEELMWNLFQIREKGDALWFLAAIFVTFIPFYFFIDRYEDTSKAMKDMILLLLSAFLLALFCNFYSLFFNPGLLPWGSTSLPWHIEYVFVAMFWMVLGYLYRQVFEKNLDGMVNNLTLIISILVFIILRMVPYLLHIRFDNVLMKLCFNYVSAFLGVFLLVYISKGIKPGKYVLYIGQNTLLCFAFHGKIYSVIQTVFKKVIPDVYSMILRNGLYSEVFAIIFTFLLSIILIVPIYIVNRYFPFLVGRKRKS